MFDPELEQAVNKIAKGEAPMSKADQYQQLKKFSNRQRTTESPESAFTKFITQDPNGKILYRKYTETRGASVGAASAPNADDASGPTEDFTALQGVAAKLRLADPSMSKQQATAAAMRTPEGARLALQDRQERTGVR